MPKIIYERIDTRISDDKDGIADMCEGGRIQGNFSRKIGCIPIRNEIWMQQKINKVFLIRSSEKNSSLQLFA